MNVGSLRRPYWGESFRLCVIQQLVELSCSNSLFGLLCLDGGMRILATRLECVEQSGFHLI
jgi:hypothetical protein